eukprot:Filipodium_phascolosomae@DN1608_c0_g1_i1.p1
MQAIARNPPTRAVNGTSATSSKPQKLHQLDEQPIERAPKIRRCNAKKEAVDAALGEPHCSDFQHTPPEQTASAYAPIPQIECKDSHISPPPCQKQSSCPKSDSWTQHSNPSIPTVVLPKPLESLGSAPFISTPFNPTPSSLYNPFIPKNLTEFAFRRPY